ncbi:hypothetical protein F5876DRAFT_65830 [Lentinula aff. lateritia]|uniref:Uncharacterized protein n=1 Tax=Lentinula aff. lateritia TaxID=2804960 RepID=A0ACC1U087_9AGAR|nr:hypothetical protein F5876DRAFT_65830 [Lentinula aff. lateritia]
MQRQQERPEQNASKLTFANRDPFPVQFTVPTSMFMSSSISITDDKDDKEDEWAPCEQCQMKKLPCLKQASKRSTVILVQEGGSNTTSKWIAMLESQMAQLLTDSWQLWDGQTRANNYHHPSATPGYSAKD